MSKPWEADDDFVMYLTSGDRGSHPLEPGVTTVRSAFRQELKIPLSLSPDWQIALLSMYYTHSFSNAVLRSPTDYHCQIGILQVPIQEIPEQSIQLSRHQQFTHVGQVLQDLIQQLDLFVIPTLSGGTHHYGQLFIQTTRSSIHGGDQTHRPKLDYFRRDLVDGWLTNHKTLPFTFLETKTYINQATNMLTTGNNVSDIWNFVSSPSKPSTHYAIDMWAIDVYKIAESLALFVGLMEPDPTRPGHTRIPDHNTLWVDTGNNTRAEFRVGLLYDVQPPSLFPLGGVRLFLAVRFKRLNYMQNRRVIFDMGAWFKTQTSILPYSVRTFPAVVVALEPDRWLLQTQQDGYIRFEHGVEKIMSTQLLYNEEHVILPPLDTPIQDLASLSNVDFSKCFVQVDVVGMSMSGTKQRHTLAVVPFEAQKYGQTCEYQPTHLDFRPLAAPTRHLNQLRVHLRNSEDLGIPFYTGLVGLLLYFHKGPTLATMHLQGGRRVILESNAQLDLFPKNKPAHFRVRLPEMWTLDETWEVGLFQLLLPHTWRNVLPHQVLIRLHYNQKNPDVDVYLQAGTYITVQDVVEGWLQVMEASAPTDDNVRGLTVVLDDRGFYKWTFPNPEFSVYLPAWLGRMLGYLDFDTWTVPFYYRSNLRHPVVEIKQRDDNSRASLIEIATSHTMSKHSQASVWSTISKYSFQNIYVHCNISEPVYMGSQMAKVILTHGVNTIKQRVEDIFIPHLMFYQLSQFQFRDIEIDIRDNLGRPIPFQGGAVTVTLYFRQRPIPQREKKHATQEEVCHSFAMGARGRRLRARHEPLSRRGLVTPVGPGGARRQLFGQGSGLQGCQTLSPVLLSGRILSPQKEKEEALARESRRQLQ